MIIGRLVRPSPLAGTTAFFCANGLLLVNQKCEDARKR